MQRHKRQSVLTIPALILICLTALFSCQSPTGNKSSNRNAPEFSKADDQAVIVNEPLSVALHATDKDNDGLKFNLVNGPLGAIFESGVFTWTPMIIGVYRLKFIVVDDGRPALSDTIEIGVAVVNGLVNVKTVVGYRGCSSRKTVLVDSINGEFEALHTDRDLAIGYLQAHLFDTNLVPPTPMNAAVTADYFFKIDTLVHNSRIAELNLLNVPKKIACLMGCPSYQSFSLDSLIITTTRGVEKYSNSSCTIYDSLYLDEYNRLTGGIAGMWIP